MDEALRRFVRERASHHCEYYGILQAHVPFAAFHIDHIIPRQHVGTDDATNLAFACYHCHLHKGPNLTGIDPDTGAIVPLFHPRRDAWHEHFALQDVTIIGLTPTGRATMRVLQMNAVERVQLRTALKPSQ
jgi:HNH endonuclease